MKFFVSRNCFSISTFSAMVHVCNVIMVELRPLIWKTNANFMKINLFSNVVIEEISGSEMATRL